MLSLGKGVPLSTMTTGVLYCTNSLPRPQFDKALSNFQKPQTLVSFFCGNPSIAFALYLSAFRPKALVLLDGMSLKFMQGSLRAEEGEAGKGGVTNTCPSLQQKYVLSLKLYYFKLSSSFNGLLLHPQINCCEHGKRKCSSN